MPVKIHILDEVNVVISGLSKTQTDQMIQEYSFYVKGFKFMPKYKMGVWDGKVKFFNRTGKTSIFLIDDFLKSFQSIGIDIDEVEVIDNREDWSHIVDDIDLIDETLFSDYEMGGKPITLRDYQVEAVNSSITNGNGIVELSTGGGKTLYIAAMAKQYSQFGRVVIIVPSIDLVIQTAENTLKKCGIDAGMWYQGAKVEKDVIVATWQSLDNARELLTDAVMVMVDECHTAGAKVLSELLITHGNHIPFRFGCTGTIPDYRLDKIRLKSLFGETIFKLTSYELRKSGTLANVFIEQFTMNDPQYQTNDDEDMNWNEVVTHYHELPGRKEKIAALINDIREEYGNTLVIVPRTKMVDDYASMIDGAMVVDGRVPIKKRGEIFKQMDEGDDQTLVATYGVASTGIDIPRLFAVVMIEPGKSFTRVVQTIGRGLRKSHDKNSVYVADIATGGPAKRQASERRTFYKKQKIDFKKTVVTYQ